MFCTHCGTRMSKDDHFCPKCGEKNPGAASEEKPEQPAQEEAKTETKPAVRPKAKWWQTLLGCFFGLLVMVFVFAAIAYGGASSASSKNAATAVMTIAISLVLLILAIFIIIAIIRGFIKKPVATAITLGILIVVIVIPTIIIVSGVKARSVESFTAFQSAFADLIAAQSRGDDMNSGDLPSDFSSVKTQASKDAEILGQIQLSGSLEEYQATVTGWAGKVRDDAQSKSTWKKHPALPDALKQPLSENAIARYWQDAIDKIAATKEFGDWAIAKGDKETMRNISGILAAENFFLANSSFATAKADSNLISFFSTAQAKGGFVFPRGHCDPGPCGGKLRRKLPPIYSAARGYTVSQPDAAAQWQTNWSDLLSDFKISDGSNTGGAGLTQGQTQNNVSPMEQAFTDECHAKGGTVGGTGGVKTRLPTTLSAGFNCNYPSGDHSCWDYLTTSGERYMGGENGCPELNLVPQIPWYGNLNNGGGNNGGNNGGGNNGGNNGGTRKTSTPTPITFDGTYHVNYTNANCNVGAYVPGGSYSSMFSSAGVSDVLYVKNNAISSSNGTYLATIKNGQAVWNYSYGYGAGTAHLVQTFNFSGNKVSGQVQIQVNVADATGTGNLNCTESFSGSK